MKIVESELLHKIEENILINGELIKLCGYVSKEKGFEKPLVEEFYEAHTKALINSKNSNINLSCLDFPRKEYICTLPKGNYLIGDFSQCLNYADKNLIREFQDSKNMHLRDIIFPDEIIPYSERRYLSNTDKKKSASGNAEIFFGDVRKSKSRIFGNAGFSFDSSNNKFLYIYLSEDEGDFVDVLDKYYFQDSMALGCIKVSKEICTRNPEILNDSGWVAGNCFSFSDDFKCTYFEDYEILKLGDFMIWKPETEVIN